MVGFRRKGIGFGVALVAALMLVLQTVAGALALGQGTPPLDIFGNPLCITSSSGHTAPAKSDHTGLTECCTLGCNMVSTTLASPPEGAALAVDLPSSRRFSCQRQGVTFPPRRSMTPAIRAPRLWPDG